MLDALSHLNSLDAAQVDQRHRAIVYLLLLILHRRPVEEHEELISLVDRYTQGMEVETMAQSMADVLIEQSMARGIEQGETRAKHEAILKLIQFRFNTVPESVATRVTSIQNRSRLDSLFEQVLVAGSLDEIDW